ncbi:hypothetical protein [Microbacterium dextranolyticum]|uniref:Uncharacterized protein n=1 Tax=Microbacterium dextranolyticum TaxID=36806 RepID=A0A9W6HK75_9MICO|nr:hypothetical protein [Microbacterium dextranolyticum]MBM7461941.1 hypothetical protein [Microbacterium dextranolyticum]GLJ94180.1 hypothetical protein GCM10017591_02410 [Microbacterium dextranolyticum]
MTFHDDEPEPTARPARPEHPAQRPGYEPVERLLRPTPYDPGMRRPATTVAGAALVLLGALVGLATIVDLLVHWREYAGTIEIELDGVTLDPEMIDASLWIVVAGVALSAAVQLVCSLLILRGHNIARVLVMTVSAISISAAFASWWARDQEITLRTTLPSLAVDILVLLALSSRSAAAYARRNQKR